MPKCSTITSSGLCGGQDSTSPTSDAYARYMTDLTASMSTALYTGLELMQNINDKLRRGLMTVYPFHGSPDLIYVALCQRLLSSRPIEVREMRSIKKDWIVKVNYELPAGATFMGKVLSDAADQLRFYPGSLRVTGNQLALIHRSTINIMLDDEAVHTCFVQAMRDLEFDSIKCRAIHG